MTDRIEILDKGYVKLVETWGSDERVIEAARMSTGKGFNGWGTPEEPKDEKLLKFLWDNHHHTPFEMAGMVIEVRAPIFVFREWHRHRTQSYNEASGRYIPLPNDNYTPSITRILQGANSVTTNKQAQGVSENVLTADQAIEWQMELEALYTQAQAVYDKGLALGVPKELARLPVPVSRYSSMRASCNLRNWLHFLSLRMDSAAQWEIREYANAVCQLIEQQFPRTRELFAGTHNL